MAVDQVCVVQRDTPICLNQDVLFLGLGQALYIIHHLCHVVASKYIVFYVLLVWCPASMLSCYSAVLMVYCPASLLSYRPLLLSVLQTTGQF